MNSVKFTNLRTYHIEIFGLLTNDLYEDPLMGCQVFRELNVKLKIRVDDGLE